MTRSLFVATPSRCGFSSGVRSRPVRRRGQRSRRASRALRNDWRGCRRRGPLPQGWTPLDHVTALKEAKAESELDFSSFRARLIETQPLSFAALVPEPSKGEYRAMEGATEVTCDSCGGRGWSSRTEDEAEADENDTQRPPSLMEKVTPPRFRCLVCDGEGMLVQIDGEQAWSVWRDEHWGCKWDANFEGPGGYFAGDSADVDASVQALGVQDAAAVGVVVYKFDTPWGPPLAFVASASGLFPGLKFDLKYGEAGLGIAGYMCFVDGVMIEEQELNPEDMLAPERTGSEFSYGAQTVRHEGSVVSHGPADEQSIRSASDLAMNPASGDDAVLSGCRSASSADRMNSGSSSRSRTPRCASVQECLLI